MNRSHFALTTLKHWVLAKSGREREGGQSIIILALGLLALLGFAGLVFDGGTAYAQFRRMQNAADAGALAGAQELTKQEGTTDALVCAAVNKYARELNGYGIYEGQQVSPTVRIALIYKDADPFVLQDPVTRPNCNMEAPPHKQAKAIQVTVSTTFHTWFLGLFGMGTGTSWAHAAAEYGNVIPQAVQPIAKRCDNPDAPFCGFVVEPQTITDIWQSDQSGNYGWLSWAGTNNASVLANELSMNYSYVGQYLDDVDTPPCKRLSVFCWVQGAPGIKTSGNPRDLDGVRQDLNIWIASGRPMIIIIYDEQSEHTGSNSDYRIAGFAAFFPTAYDLDHKHLWGYFGRWVMEGQICEDCKDTGVYTVKLIPDVVLPPPTPPSNGTIYVHVLNDVNQSNTAEPLGPDYYAQRAVVRVTGPNTDKTITTQGVSGNSFPLPPGNYTVQETNPTTPVNLPLDSDGFPNIQTVNLHSAEVVDVWFLDYTADNADLIVKVADGDVPPPPPPGFAPFQGAYVSVVDAGNGTAGTGTTPSTGILTFTKLPIGSYTVYANATNHASTPQSITLTNGMTGTVTLTMHDQDTGSLHVHVFDDQTNGLPNVQVTATGPGGYLTKYTDGAGNVLFDQILTGSYTVIESNPPGYESVLPQYPDTLTGQVVQKDTPTDVNFQDRLPQKGTICILAFDDITGDGNWSPGETLLPGALIRILSGANEIGRWTTNGTEPHCYPNLPMGTYSIQETNPLGYYSTTVDTQSLTFTSTSQQDVRFGDRMATPTPTQTPTRTGTPTKTPTRTATPTRTLTKTPGPSPTPSITPTPTITPIPGALCVTVFQDTNSNGTWDTTPPAPPPAPTPTVAFTPEVLLAPQDVSVINAQGTPVGTWDGSGGQPHCLNGLYPGNYSAIETNPTGYGSTTADSIGTSVQSSMYTSVFFGDLLCLPRGPVMGQVTYEGGSYWLHWENVGADSYEIFGSFSCQSTNCPTPGAGTPQPWHSVAVVSVINYKVVQATDGTFFYVVARNKCGASGPSNVVALP